MFRMFAEGMVNLLESSQIESEVIVAGSEGAKSRHLAEEYDFTYIEQPNQPLATKMNATTLACQDKSPDYVFALGSDDVFSKESFDLYIEKMNEGIDYIGVLDFYFYDLATKTALYWGGYRGGRAGNPCGAGRCFSRRLMDVLGWRLWETRHNGILDTTMDEKLKSIPHTEYMFRLKEHGVLAVDIKSRTNMTPYAMWDNTFASDPAPITSRFPFLCVE